MQTATTVSGTAITNGAGRNRYGQFARGRQGVDRLSVALLEQAAWEAAHPAEAAEKDARFRMEWGIQYGATDTNEDGTPRVYRVTVKGEEMIARVRSLNEDLVIGFIGQDKRRRYLLITPDAEGRPVCWLHLPETGEFVRHHGKYAVESTLIVALRAFERETGLQRTGKAN